MPATDLADALFTDVDWDVEGGGGRRVETRTLALLLALATIAALLAYDLLVRPAVLIGPLNWDPSRMAWLLLVSLVLFGRYMVYPLAADRRRTATYVREFRSRPAGVASFLLLLALGLVAVVGPEVFYTTYPRLADRLQPPVYTSVSVADTTMVYECAGRLVDQRCHGTWQYPLGTTRIGEDLVLLLARGTRVAFVLGFSAAAIMGVVATAVGTTAGYVGGWVDDVLMSYVDVQQTVPAVVVYIILSTMFLGDITGVTQGGLFAVAVVFGLLDWGGIARLVRGEVKARRSNGYVRAARAAGASDLQIIRRHVIPNSTGTIVTALTRRIPLLVLAQTALAFLEVHRAGSRSFGRLLRLGLDGRYFPWYQKWWMTSFVVVLLVCIVVAFGVFGDEVRDVIDPGPEVR